MNKYGKFSADGREFIINTPTTPRPWVNYLTNELYWAIISQSAGGYSFYRDLRSNCLLRWSPESWHLDRPGRYIFLYDSETGKYWSASYKPIRARYDLYQCRHGLGYTIIESVTNQIKTKITFFVPQEEPCEIWLVEIKNLSRSNRKLRIYPYVELLIGDYQMDVCYRDIMKLYNRVWYDSELKSILGKKTVPAKNMDTGLVFFTSNLPVVGYCTKKDIFLGQDNTEEHPETVMKGKIPKFAFCSGEEAIASLSHEITLEPEATKHFVIILGQTKNYRNVKKLVEKYRNTKNCLEEFERTKNIWKERITNNIIIETPDKDFDNIINIWAKYQLFICNFWPDSFPNRDCGNQNWRDFCQNAEAICSIAPEYTRKKILTVTKFIQRDGNRDYVFWLTSTVSSYIKETGDKKILLKKLSCSNNKQKLVTRCDRETLYEHLRKNLGHGNWNDYGESVLVAMQLVHSLKILAELAILIGKKKDAQKLLQRAEIVKNRINRNCWDGNWYIRGTTATGNVFGSKKCGEGKIFLDTQSWAIVAGIPSRNRLKRLLHSVDRYLEGKHGYALFYPAYTQWRKAPGKVAAFSEGTKENASVSTPATTLMIIADTIAGRGTKAYQSMKKIMPNCQKDYDLYKTEPYVYADYLVGPEHPYLYGEGAFSWITATAGLSFLWATEWLSGVKKNYSGLVLDPRIPGNWKEIKIRRPFRKDIYEITIENPYRVEKGVEEILVDGKKITGNIIIPFGDGKTHSVKVIMGRRGN